jgi:DNA helicase HerA-like ATPase
VPRSGDPLVYNLRDPPADSGKEPAIFRHLLIAGTTGKGKTHSTKNLITQIIGRGSGSRYDTDGRPRQICGLILDPDNEYSQLAQPPEDDVTEWERQGFISGPLDDVHAFVPVADGVSGPQPPADKVTRVSIPFEIVRDRPEVMSLDANGPTANLMRRTLNRFFGRHSNPEYRDFVSWIEKQDKDDFNANGNMWNAMLRRVHKDHFKAIFDQGSQSILDMAQEMFKPGRVSVVPTDHLRGDRERFLVMFLISWVVENKISNDDPVECIRDTPLLFSVDEAHNYLSGSGSSQGDYIIENFVEAAKQGRKRNLALQLTTQNPGDVDDDVIKQINTRIYMGLEDEVVQDISVPRGFGQRITLFDQGQMAVKAPDTQPTEVVSLPDCLVQH